MATKRGFRIGSGILALSILSGCMEGTGLPGFLSAPGAGARPEAAAVARTEERDVESPEVFEVTAQGLWDGRPSLGGIWVAHPGVSDPERVLIRNEANGRTVNGALFRRERDNPGPPLQVSAEAAAAIGLLAGQPAELYVVALRRVEVTVEPEPAADATAPPVPEAARPKPRPGRSAAPAAAATAATVAPVTTTISAEPLDPLAAATRAVEDSEAAAEPGAPSRPWLQIGMFTTQANAEATVAKLAAEGVTAKVAGGVYRDERIWRVLMGPAADQAAMRALGDRAAALGYDDAYPVAR